MESPQKARDDYKSKEPTVRTEPLGTKEELLQILIPEARLELEKTDPGREALRVYQDEKNFWRIAARWEYLWSEARALQDADDVMTDSMALPPEEETQHPTQQVQ